MIHAALRRALAVLALAAIFPARAFDLGVEGIISDRPDLVREEMRKRGMVLSAPTPVTP